VRNRLRPWPSISDDWPLALAQLATTATVLVGAVLALGWVEDLGARRPLRISPFVKRRPTSPVPAGSSADTPAPVSG